MKFVVLKDLDTLWYWELRLPEGTLVARSTGHRQRDLAFQSLQSVREKVKAAQAFDPLGTLYEGI